MRPTGQGRQPEHRRPGAVAALVLILPPLVAALVSGGTGAVFWAGSLLGVVGAAALCSRPGVWWVTTGAPPVVLLMALLGLAVRDSSAGTSKLGTDLAKVVAGAFPVMGAALLGAVAVGAARTLSARRVRGIGVEVGAGAGAGVGVEVGAKGNRRG
ncbi:hypothetical protein SAMN05414137_119106 [Streptacidiphilus jiangxiensis]|uniref:DUF6542 domain-containing protein n=2 Tax=Streptacidiphilus jiangxiensis TaxID=235985 RepID=A0A1H7VYU9_STRJI|nr:hypothetical protein SAMN05414137_119106 [Streptacidiphilus jiangxiensis]